MKFYKIVGMPYGVDFLYDKDLRGSAGDLLYGCQEHCSQTIKIAEYGYHRNCETVIHEVVHAYMDELDLSQRESFTKEDICNFFAKWGGDIIDTSNEILDDHYGKDRSYE